MADWDSLGTRGSVDDRRGRRGVALGTTSITSVLLLMGMTYLLGGNPLSVLETVPLDQIVTTETGPTDTSEFARLDTYETFASTVVGSLNEFWTEQLASSSTRYAEPTLVLFRDATDSACGGARSAYGPHYCPTDSTIYLDETFFDELTSRLGATGGDVAEAYVIAHEVGHHVQSLTHTLDQTDSITTELQADCYAGLWLASLPDRVLEPGETAEALNAAAAVGDDHIQEVTTGTIHKETWNHGSSADRQAAFTRGYKATSYLACR